MLVRRTQQISTGHKLLEFAGVSSKMEISANGIGLAEGFRTVEVLGQMSEPAKVAGSRIFEADHIKVDRHYGAGI